MGLFNSFISSMRDVASEVTSFAKNSFEEEENNEVEYGDDSQHHGLAILGNQTKTILTV